jgi:hypothetical protein
MTTSQFTFIKEYILLKGDRQTYSNMYNNNPHLVFGTRHVYLNPIGGQLNINCDPTLSDFDTIVIQDWSSSTVYYNIKLNDDGQTLTFNPPDAKVLFEQLYLFVHGNKQAN